MLPFGHTTIQYCWNKIPDRKFGGRLYILVCEKNPVMAPEDKDEAYHIHEYADIFSITHSDVIRDKNGKLVVNDITYSVQLNNGEEHPVRFNRDCDDTVEGHIIETVEDLYDNDENKVPHVRHALEMAIAKHRKERQEKINNFLGNNDESLIKTIQVFKIYPLNFPAATTHTLSNRFYNSFTVKVVSNSQSLLAPELFSPNTIPRCVVDFDIKQGVDSPFGKICQVLLIDLLSKTRYLSVIQNENGSVYNCFGVGRIFQHITGKELGKINAFMQGHFSKFIKEIVTTITNNVKLEGRIPEGVSDYMQYFLFQNRVPKDSDFTFDRFATSVQFSSELNKWDQLEIQLEGNDTFMPIHAANLTNFISSDGFVTLILDLLAQPEYTNIAVPAGWRENLELEEKEKSVTLANCFKNTLLKIPDELLSPKGKLRVKKVFPDHEISFDRANIYIQKYIKTISLKKEKENLNVVAMTSHNVMIAAFSNGSTSHSVLINGNKGTITDPIDSYGTVERSNIGLRKMGIADFHSVYTLKRRPLSEKSRRGLKKRLRLPFV